MNKRFLKTVGNVILAFIIVLVIYGAARTAKHILGLDYMSKEEMTELFNDNFDIFEDTAAVLSDINKEIVINKNRSSINDGWDTAKISYGLSITSYDNEYCTEHEINEINQSNISYIMNKLNFLCVNVRDGCVYFTKYSAISFSAGILYIPADKSPKDRELYSAEQIGDGWYYFTSE